MSRLLIAVFLVLLCSVSESMSETMYTAEAQFATLYAQVLRGVEEGSLSQATAKEARLINGALQKKLTEYDTRIEVLKNDTLTQSIERRPKNIEELIEVSAQKERVIFNFLQKMGKLSMSSPGQRNQPGKANNILGNNVVFDMRVDGGADNKQQRLTVESLPEDISTGEFD